MEHHPVINETFAGLARPTQTFELGRPDITEDRPGAVLVAAVKEFEADEGFKKIAEQRGLARAEDEKADAAVVKTKPAGGDIAISLKDSHEGDLKRD